MRTSYTSLHDLKDIFLGIYKDNIDYKVKFWNFTDYKYMNISFFDVDDHEDIKRINFFTRYHKKDDLYGIKTVEDWQEFIKRIDDNTPRTDNSEIYILNTQNGKPMNICFSGGDNLNKTVNFIINYKDNDYRKWKRDLRMFWLRIKCKITKFIP